MVIPVWVVLALGGCNPPLEENDAPFIRVDSPAEGAIVNGGAGFDFTVTLIDRDGDTPISLSVTSDIDGEWFNSAEVAEGEPLTFTVPGATPGPHVVTLVANDGRRAGERTTTLNLLSNSPPTAPGLVISPADPDTLDNLVGSVDTIPIDPEGLALLLTWTWSNGVDAPIEGSFTTPPYEATVPASATTKNQDWTFTVRATELTEGGNVAEGANFSESSVTATIANSPPTAPSVDLFPANPTPGDDLSCRIVANGTDIDGDEVTYSYAWKKDGADVAATTPVLDAFGFAPNQVWTCEATATDGQDAGGTATASVTIGSRDVGVASLSGSSIVGDDPELFAGHHAVGAPVDATAGNDLVMGLPLSSKFDVDGGLLAVFRGELGFSDDEIADRDITVDGFTSAHLGGPLCTVDDVDGDGDRDLLASSAGSDGVVDPAVYFLSGGGLASALVEISSTSAGFSKLVHDTPAESAGFGVALAGGDVTGDGDADILIGQAAAGAAGRVWMFNGASISPNTSLDTSGAVEIASLGTDDRFGSALAAGGQATGDASHDVLIGDASRTTGSAAFLFDGNDVLGTIDEDDAVLAIGSAGDDEVGAQVAFIGDLDGDGFDEIAVTAPGASNGGELAIFRGAATFGTDLDWTQADLVITGVAAGQRFGDRLVVVADRGQDGLPELLIGAPATQVGANAGAGRVYLFTSAHLVDALDNGADLDADDADVLFSGQDAGDALNAVGDLGDLDLDGIPDLMVGAPQRTEGLDAHAGRLYLYLTGP